MIDYILGKVVKIDSLSIVLDFRGIGFKIYCSDTSFYKLDEEYKVYIYIYSRENIFNIYGFKTDKEKQLFLKLIDINGVGPKIANCILSIGSVEEIIYAINNEDYMFLRSANNVSTKLSQQIILDLKGKVYLEDNEQIIKNTEYEDARNALLSLSFKSKEIDPILYKAKSSCSTSKEYFYYVLKCIGNSRGN